MSKVELKEGTSVFTSDGKEVGKINRFVLNPSTDEVTHIVIQKGWLLPEDKVVPFRMIGSVTEDRVELNEDIDDFEKLPPFEETHYIEADNQAPGYPAGKVPAYYLYPPDGYLGYPAYGLGPYSWPPVETERNIPKNTVPLKEGSDVISSDDKHIGDIERLFIQGDSHRVTHLLVSHGLLSKEKKVIPAGWIQSVEEDKVHLSVPSRLFERLPAYES